MYCTHCGNPIAESDPAEAAADAAAETAGALEGAAEATSTSEVEIARINADKEITLAKIEKGILAEAIEAQVAEDAVKADLLEQVLEPPEPEPVPVVLDDAGPAEPELDGEPPPVVDETPAPEPAAKSKSNPWWSTGDSAIRRLGGHPGVWGCVGPGASDSALPA